MTLWSLVQVTAPLRVRFILVLRQAVDKVRSSSGQCAVACRRLCCSSTPLPSSTMSASWRNVRTSTTCLSPVYMNVREPASVHGVQHAVIVAICSQVDGDSHRWVVAMAWVQDQTH